MDILVSPVALAAPQWVVDLLNGGAIYALAEQLWQFVMHLVYALLGMDITDFTADGAGAYEENASGTIVTVSEGRWK